MATVECRPRAFHFAIEVVATSVKELEFTVAFTYSLIASKVATERREYKRLLKHLEKARISAEAAFQESMDSSYNDFASKLWQLREKIIISEDYAHSKILKSSESCSVM